MPRQRRDVRLGDKLERPGRKTCNSGLRIRLGMLSRNNAILTHRAHIFNWESRQDRTIVGVRSEEHPRKKPYASELEKLMTWFRKAGVSSLIRAEWTPPMFLAIIITTEGQGPMSASVQTSTGLKIDVEIIQHSTPQDTEAELRGDL